MITLKELNPHDYLTNDFIDANLQILLERVNKVRTAYGVPMIVTSGLRSQEDQQKLIAAGKSNAPKSHHLTGEAIDIYDPDGKLNTWTLENTELMEEIGLWMEQRQGTWQHYQIVAPHSGSRFFNP